MKHKALKLEFVEFIPEEISEGVLYISMKYGTAVHKCCSGCGNDVVTPLSPTDWQLTFDGESISLFPSIGNWSFACRSHYWIKNNKIVWASLWTEKRIKAGRKKDKEVKKKFFISKKK
jgi:hypothetical protein